MTIIQFPIQCTAVHRAVAQGNTQHTGWAFEIVTADDGTLSIAAECADGRTLGIHPGPNGWGCVSFDGSLVGVYRSPIEAVTGIAL